MSDSLMREFVEGARRVRCSFENSKARKWKVPKVGTAPVPTFYYDKPKGPVLFNVVIKDGLVCLDFENETGNIIQLYWTKKDGTWNQYNCNKKPVTKEDSFHRKYGIDRSYMLGILDAIDFEMKTSSETIDGFVMASLIKRAEKAYKQNVQIAVEERKKILSLAAQESAEIRLKKGLYPSVPEPSFVLKRNVKIPDTSGIYFAYEQKDDHKIIAYVGQSIKFSSRISISHGKLKAGDLIALLEMDKEDLNYAEAFYIGILRPYRNF